MFLIIGAAVLIVFLVASRAIASFYIDYLWHGNLGRTDVFWGILDAKLFLFVGFAVLFGVLAVLNLLIADRLAPSGFTGDTHPVVMRFHELFGHRMRLVRIVAGVIMGLIVAVPASGHWQEWLLFRNSVSFGKTDPQFATDIGFYVFRLPFLTFLIDWLFLAVLLVLFLTVAAHILNGGIVITPPMPKIRRASKAHFAVLLAVLAVLRGGGYWLERYKLTTERRGYVQGATYSVVKAQLPAILLLMLIALLVGALFLYSIRSGSWRIPLVASALWVVIALLGGVIYPSIVQALVVNPDQKEKEQTYIDRNITATRDALGINNVKTQDVSFGDLTATKVTADTEPLKDVRLLDPTVLLSRFTFDEGQVAGLAIKDLDVDRYNIDGREQQTIVAARELDLKNVANTSWQGKHLIATHGCGVVAAPASQVGDNNRPLYENLQTTHPELYFSAAITDFAVVDTTTSEKPCDGVAASNYTGNGGVELNSSLKKLAFAWSFFDYNLWGSDSITDTSRIQWIRDVRERAQKLAPFLYFDRDPYPVVLNGKVLWVIDAFTTTDQYPYAQDGDRSQLDANSGLDHTFNYVRNSVKVTVDAYTGDVTFYQVDKADPILKAWESAFPKLFVDVSQAPKGLTDHFRYPEDLFRVQTAAYARYQLSPSEFFERTGAWSVAQAPSTTPHLNSAATADTTLATDAVSNQAADDAGSTSERFTPYYTMFHPPGSDDAGTFSLFRPFVPYSKDDSRTELQAFMVASSDPKNYGQLTSYVVNPTVDGPLKVAASAESADAISRELTLLNSAGGGSDVSFGDVQLVPLSGGVLYLRPLFVSVNGQANYRKIIVSYNAIAVIDDTIGGALRQLFPGFSADIGDRTSTTTDGTATTTPSDGSTATTTPADGGTTATTVPDSDQTPDELLQQAQTLFDEADAALAQTPPDYATYGSKQSEARDLIAQAITALQGS
ncbi:MAG: hypothetical protein JWM34_1925 [Ilumatobacteraceae bacterium]|nr:hypothetical protein [Ilumatobacteraceae bacterium]